jgi:hypothetical protein
MGPAAPLRLVLVRGGSPIGKVRRGTVLVNSQMGKRWPVRLPLFLLAILPSLLVSAYPSGLSLIGLAFCIPWSDCSKVCEKEEH